MTDVIDKAQLETDRKAVRDHAPVNVVLAGIPDPAGNIR